MGNDQTKNQLPDKANFHILDYGYCKVWKRKADQIEIMEEYPVYIESEQRLKLYQSIWPLRTNHSLFVNVYHFSHSQQANFCSNSAKGCLYTERIPFRLSQFSNIKYPEIVKILKASIEGFKILYDNFGAFIIRSTMIGFTESFRVKVWFHTDFSEPEPENPNCKSLQEMFTSLINAVQSTCEHLYYNCPRFSQFIVQTNYIYFQRDFDYLMQGLNDYARKLQLRMPEDLKHLKSYLKKPQGWQKFKAKNNYPKILISETQIQSDTATSQHLTERNIQIPVRTKAPVSISNNQLKKSPSIQQLKSQTNDRNNFSKIQPGSKTTKNSPSQINQYFSPRNIKPLNSPQQITQKEQYNSWINSESIAINKQKISLSTQRTSTQTNQFQRIPQKMSFKNPSNQYFGDFVSTNGDYFSKRSSSTKNENFPRKSFDRTTDSRNHIQSFDSQISLIEDLENLAKKYPSNQKIYYK